MKYSVSENSPLTHVSTVIKFFITLFFSVFIVFISTHTALLFLCVCSTLYCLLLYRLKLLIIIYFFITLMAITAYGFGELIMYFMAARNSNESYSMFIPFLRIAVIMNVSLAFILSTPARLFMHLMKQLHTPRVIFIPLFVIFRFIPQFIHEISLIHESIKVRLGSFSFVTFLLHPLLAYRCVTMPAVVRALRVAEQLAAAAEMKGLEHAHRISSSHLHKFSFYDFLVIAFTSIIVIITVFYNSIPYDIF